MTSGLLTNAELVAAARHSLDDADWDWLVGAAESETTALRNRMSLDCVALRPRVLVGVADLDLSTELLGRSIRSPVLLANLGDPHRLWPDGADELARAAGHLEAPRFGPARPASGPTADDRAGAARSIVEISAHRGWEEIRRLVREAGETGCLAVCLGLVPHESGRRERESNRPGVRPRRTRDVWSVVERTVECSDLPVIVKGVMTGADAVAALEHGCAAVYVSNYGGRVLDHCQGTIDVLPEVVEAVDGRAEVVVDGGFQRGTDVVKALAAGAQAVAIGRLQGFGLAAGGAAGLVRAVEILEEELRVTMSLVGATAVADLGRGHLSLDAPPVQLPHETSAYFRSPDDLSAAARDSQRRSGS